MRNLIQSLQELAQMLQNLFDLNKIDPARKYRNIINTFRIPLPYKYMKWGSIAIITIAFVITFLSGIQNGQIIWGIVRNESGGLAWGLLVFTIYVSLACKLFPKVIALRQLFPLRKYTGIGVFFIVLGHLIAHLLQIKSLSSFREIYAASLQSGWEITIGTIALIIMVPLLLTSTNSALKALGSKGWTLLHKLTHIVFILSAVHIAFIGGEVEGGPLMILLFYGIAYLWLFIQKRKKRLDKKTIL
ncbi:hypothetical protein HC823_01595 [Candidatus Gracilibacteria bacterium]|nr:hypothetical protein [Candidatus Gracilibacteria bacterium]